MADPRSKSQMLIEKWGQVLDTDAAPEIKGYYRQYVTAQLMENSEREARAGTEASGVAMTLLGEAAPTNSVANGGVANFDPILISMIRRLAPNLMAYDVCGVQPMSGPTGIIFCMHSRYSGMANTNPEALFNEANTAFATSVSGANTINQKMVGTVPGNTSQTSLLAQSGLYNFATGVATANLEAGFASGTMPEMAFDITKQTVTAVGRGLMANYSIEIAQDLKAIHGLDAETELQNILSTEILAEINREVIRSINVTAVPGAQNGQTATAGVFNFDVDSNGRWSVEKWKGFMFQLEREANYIAKTTRRGKGNILITSSDVASALAMAGVLDYSQNLLGNRLEVDDTGNTFVGVLNGRFRVYIDPYSGGDYATVGYKGASPWDAGLFYCPYTPLQLLKAVDPSTFQPKIAFKSRYAIAPNPYAKGTTIANLTGTLEEDTNLFYRRVICQNLM